MDDKLNQEDNQKDKEINKLMTLEEMGLSDLPKPGEDCAYEGKETCGTLHRVLRCENGKWENTGRSCP